MAQFTSADLQSIADLTIEAFGLSIPAKVEWNRLGDKASRGHARYRTNYISIPKWAEAEGEDFLLYYVIHEVSHLVAYAKAIVKPSPHGAFFKRIESEAMRLWGIELVFPTPRSAYPNEIVCNGMSKWQRNVQ